MFFDDWAGIGRTVVVGVCAYGALIVILRSSGKRTLAKLNAFDLVVTVALGSTLATILLSRDVALAEGLVALGLLVSMQFAVAWMSVRSGRVEQIVKSDPSLLLYRGTPKREEMKRQRITEEELRSAVRSAGIDGLDNAGAVFLETDGTFSVISLAALSAERH